MPARITPAMFNILVALAEGPLHGYGVMQEVEALTGGKVRMGAGTLYRSIKSLLDDGLIAETSGPEEDDDERRRYYRLTQEGERIATSEATRMADLVAAAKRRGLLGRRVPQGSSG